MDDNKSPIGATIGFGADGKHHGHLSVPYSRDSSAWGSLMIPITVIKNGDGPTALLTGANHGDEYEGPIALTKLRRALDPDRVSGRIIVIPALNYPAFRAARRTSPIDGGNMNRAFPGRPDGTITEKIAHYVDSVLVPMADIAVDIHSGGKTLNFLPSAIIHRLDDTDLMAKTLAALRAFGAPVGLVLEELDAAGMLDTAVETRGKVFISTELGGGGTATPETVSIAETGLSNLLKHAGILEGVPDHPWGPTRMMHTPGRAYVIAGDGGLLEMTKSPGDAVLAGETVGVIHYVEHPDREPMIHAAEKDGILIARHHPGLVERGDCLALIGEDYSY